jgi:RNA polymerase sigma factor (sigma-70 family)
MSMALPTDSDRNAPPATPDLEAWLVQFGPGLRRYFTKRAGAADADDLVQEVFVRLHARAAGGQVDNVERYLFTVANHVLISRHRHDSARPWSRQSQLLDTMAPVEDVTPERVLIGRQEYQRMIEALRKLPPRAREAFIFHRFEEMSHPAIARRMGISVIAVRKLISRAMARIAEIMEERA